MKRSHNELSNEDNDRQSKKRKFSKGSISRVGQFQSIVSAEEKEWVVSDDFSIIENRLDVLEEAYHYAKILSQLDLMVPEEVIDSIYAEKLVLVDAFEAAEDSALTSVDHRDFRYEVQESIQEFLESDASFTDATSMREALNYSRDLLQRMTDSHEKFLNDDLPTWSPRSEVEQKYNSTFGDCGQSFLNAFYYHPWSRDSEREVLEFTLQDDLDDYSDTYFDEIDNFESYDPEQIPTGYLFEEGRVIPLETLSEQAKNNQGEEFKQTVKSLTIDWNNLVSDQLPFMQLVKFLIKSKPEKFKDQMKSEADDLENYLYVSDVQYGRYLKLLQLLLNVYRKIESRVSKKFFPLFARVITRQVIDQFAIYSDTVPEEYTPCELSVIDKNVMEQEGYVDSDYSDSDDDVQSVDLESADTEEEDADPWDLWWKSAPPEHPIPAEVSRTVADNYLYTNEEDGTENPLMLQHWNRNTITSWTTTAEFNHETRGYEGLLSDCYSDDESDSEEDADNNLSEEDTLEIEDESIHLNGDGEEHASIHRDLILLLRKSRPSIYYNSRHTSAQGLVEVLFCLRKYLKNVIELADRNSVTNEITEDDVTFALSQSGTQLYTGALDRAEDLVTSDMQPSTITQIDLDLAECTIEESKTQPGRIRLLNNDTNSDVTLIFKDSSDIEYRKKLRREILSLRCPYFHAMLNEDSKLLEANVDLVDMSESFPSSQTFLNVLYYIYTESFLPDVELQTIVDVYAVAPFFLLNDLTKYCDTELAKWVADSNVEEIIPITRVLELPQVLYRVERIMVDRDLETLDYLTELEKCYFGIHQIPITTMNVVSKLEQILTMMKTAMEDSTEDGMKSLSERLNWWKIQYVWFIVRNRDTMLANESYNWFTLQNLTCPRTGLSMKVAVDRLYEEMNVPVRMPPHEYDGLTY